MITSLSNLELQSCVIALGQRYFYCKDKGYNYTANEIWGIRSKIENYLKQNEKGN